ncbi:sulfotransferase [Thiocapsa bogorovii]|nr:sulfotransferase [Thiocapsa bogorovii]UHD18944.1 sulfotransferase [Thiocapsa bogorovii]
MQGCSDFGPAADALLRRLASADRAQHDSRWLKDRVVSFRGPVTTTASGLRWGWKEPNTHVVLDRLMEAMPELKYVHVFRNGLDMAYSRNQNQLRLWGPSFLGMDPVPVDPRHALKYWCRVHERLLGVFERFPGRGLMLNFDALCAEPLQSLVPMLRFIEVDPSLERIEALTPVIRPPASIGRFRTHDSSLFDPEDVRFVANLGFPVGEQLGGFVVSSNQRSESSKGTSGTLSGSDIGLFLDRQHPMATRPKAIAPETNGAPFHESGRVGSVDAVDRSPRVLNTHRDRSDPSQRLPGDRRTALLVLGMHRSGTSAFTRVSGLLGGALPRDLMPPVKNNNETGFWESMGIYELDDLILKHAGTRWDDWRALPSDWLHSAISNGFKERAIDVVREAFQDDAFIIVKDPRICRLVPFWREVFREMEMDVLHLLPVRNPLEVAASLRRRDGFDPAKAYLLWLRHTLDAEVATRGSRRSITTFQRLMSDWRTCVTDIKVHLGVTWPRIPQASSAAAIDAFLQDGLRHNRASDHELYDDQNVPDWVKATFRSMLELSHRPDSPSALSVLDGVRAELDKATQAIGPTVRLGEIDEERPTPNIETGKPRSDQRTSRLLELESTVLLHQLETEALRSEILASESRVSELDSVVMHNRSLIEDLRRKITELEIGGQKDRMTAVEQRLRNRHLETSLGTSQRRIETLTRQRDAMAFRVNAFQSTASWQLGRYVLAAEQRFPRMMRSVLAAPKWALWFLTMRASDRFRLRSEVRRLRACGLFDEAWYVSSYPEILASGHHAAAHWSLIGWRHGLEPNPLFKTRWYLENNRDVDAAGIDPLLHYCAQGAFEGRDPHPCFSSSWYLEKNPDVAQSEVNPLMHFLEAGAKEQRDPHPSFQISKYLTEHPEIIATGVNPLIHFLSHGEEEVRIDLP